MTETPSRPAPIETSIPSETLSHLFRRFLRFGLLAWGGPVAQIAMLRHELVDRERWISSERFNRTLAVYQALPGPEAHELCVFFGHLARGRIGGFLAGLGFMLPGLVLMLALSWLYVRIGLDAPLFLALFAGTQAAVLALIVRAVHRIGSHAITDPWLALIAIISLAAALAGVGFLVILAVSGIAYLLVARGLRLPALALLIVAVAVAAYGATASPGQSTSAPQTRTDASQATPLVEASAPELLASGLRAGLLTFGGAYTAIPLLQDDAVERNGWMTNQTFLDGVALSGMLPAPLIIFSTFVGYVAGGPLGALAMTLGVFAPAFLITLVGHRQLGRLVEHGATHALLDGVTAGVVGLIAAASLLLAPVAIRGPGGAAIFAVSLVSLYVWRSGLVVAAVVAGAGVVGLLLFGVIGLSA